MPSRSLIAVAAGVIGLVAISILMPPTPRLVWNVSESAPRGLYNVLPGSSPKPGDMVVAHMPAPVRRLAAVRHYLPGNVPLVKRVAAGAGQQICAIGASVQVDGRRVAVRRLADARGRTMPWWTGCVRLKDGQVLLLMDQSDSFDGRYFGPTSPPDVLGRARLVWARPTRSPTDA